MEGASLLCIVLTIVIKYLAIVINGTEAEKKQRIKTKVSG